MSETVSVRLDPRVKKRLEALARSTKRSRSFLAAEAIAAYVQDEEWQIAETRSGLKDLEEGRTVSHDRVSKWLRTWGRKDESRAPK